MTGVLTLTTSFANLGLVAEDVLTQLPKQHILIDWKHKVFAEWVVLPILMAQGPFLNSCRKYL